MCIQELIDQFTIQGMYCIKTYDNDMEECVILAEGNDFEWEQCNIREDYLNSDIIYMYVEDGVLNIEVEF